MKRFFCAVALVCLGAMGTRAATERNVESNPTILPDSIVVTANRFGLSSQSSVWPVSQLSRAALEDEANLETALDGASGLDVRNQNGSGSLSTVSNWGLYNRHLLLLYNGRVVKDYSLGGFNLSDYSVDELERVEILKGPQSAFYGADAVGGVVNLISQTALVNRLELGTRIGNYGYRVHTLNLSRRLGSFGVGSYAEYSTADNHRDNSGTERVLMNLRTDYLSPNSQHHLSVSARYFHDSLGVPGPVPDPAYVPAYGNSDANSLFDHQKDENYSVDLQYRFDNARLGDLQVDLFWEKKNLDYNSLYSYQYDWYTIDTAVTPHDSTVNRDSVDVYSGSAITKRSSGASARYMRHLSQWLVAGGVDFLSGSIKSTSADVNQATNILGPFAPYGYDWSSGNYWAARQDQFDVWANTIADLHSRFRLDLSGRIQLIKGRESQPSYNLGLIYRPETNISLKIGQAYAFRLPSIADQFAEDVYTAGNDQLGPETSHSTVGTVSVRSFDSRVIVNLSGFRQTVDSLTQYQLDESSFKYVPRNVDKFKTTGIDLNLEARYSDALRFNFSGVFQSAQQTISGGEEFVAAHYVPDLKWRAAVVGVKGGVTGSLTLNYTSDRSILFSGSQKAIDAVYELGMSAGVRVSRQLRLSLTGYDLTDRARPDQFGFSLSDGDYPSPGRRITMAVHWSI